MAGRVYGFGRKTPSCEIRVLDEGPKDVGKEFVVAITGTYDPDWLDEFKTNVFPQHRRWDDRLKIWYTTIAYLEDLKDLALKYFSLVTLVEGNFITDLRTGLKREQLSLF